MAMYIKEASNVNMYVIKATEKNTVNETEESIL